MGTVHVPTVAQLDSGLALGTGVGAAAVDHRYGLGVEVALRLVAPSDDLLVVVHVVPGLVHAVGLPAHGVRSDFAAGRGEDLGPVVPDEGAVKVVPPVPAVRGEGVVVAASADSTEVPVALVVRVGVLSGAELLRARDTLGPGHELAPLALAPLELLGLVHVSSVPSR